MVKERILSRRRLTCGAPILSNKPPKIEEDYINMEHETKNIWNKHYVTASGAENGFYQIKDGSFVVAILKDYFDIDEGSITRKETEASLISAAPELLKACKMLMSMIDEGVPEHEWDSIKNDARAAIDKAMIGA